MAMHRAAMRHCTCILHFFIFFVYHTLNINTAINVIVLDIAVVGLILVKVLHKALVNHIGCLSLHRKSVVRLTDCPYMTSSVYHGHKTTITN